MRLFLALGFDDESKDALCGHMRYFFDICEKGVFTKKENIYITLALFPDSTRVGAIIDILDTLNAGKFDIRFSGDGEFKRAGGDVYWLGIEKESELMAFHKKLCRSLASKGVIMEKYDFKPHITVSRDTVIRKAEIPRITFDKKITATRLSLIKYECTREGPRYTEVYAKDL